MESVIFMGLFIVGCLNIILTKKSLKKICDEIKKEYPQKISFDFLIKTVIEKYTKKQNRRTGFALLCCSVSFFVFLLVTCYANNRLLRNITDFLLVASAMGILTCFVRFVATNFYSTRNRISEKLGNLPDEWIVDLLAEENIRQTYHEYREPELTPSQKKELEIRKKKTFFPTLIFGGSNSQSLTKNDMLGLIAERYQQQRSYALFFAIPFSLGGIIFAILGGLFWVFTLCSFIFFAVGLVAFVLFFKFKRDRKKRLESISLEKLFVERITNFEKYIDNSGDEAPYYYICTEEVKIYVSESEYIKINAKNDSSKSDELLFVHMSDDIPLVICLSAPSAIQHS